MSHLSVYLDQMAVSCQGIRSLPFPPPKVFTNALLANDDITSLIRDTEAHERALFSVPPRGKVGEDDNDDAPDAAAASATSASATSATRRRQTVFHVAAGEVTTGPPSARPSAAPRRNTAVAAVLGRDLHAQIAAASSQGPAAGAAGPGSGQAPRPAHDVDVGVLLRGAEKLCSVYALPGARERIPVLRQKHAQQTSTLAYYEAKVAEQAQRLAEMRRVAGSDAEEHDGSGDRDAPAPEAAAALDLPTEDDLRREEDEIRELERRKKELQARLRAMDKDLGGLLL